MLSLQSREVIASNPGRRKRGANREDPIRNYDKTKAKANTIITHTSGRDRLKAIG